MRINHIYVTIASALLAFATQSAASVPNDNSLTVQVIQTELSINHSDIDSAMLVKENNGQRRCPD